MLRKEESMQDKERLAMETSGADELSQQESNPNLCLHVVSTRANAPLDAADTIEAATRSPHLREVLVKLKDARMVSLT